MSRLICYNRIFRDEDDEPAVGVLLDVSPPLHAAV